MRDQSSKLTVSATPRQLESLIRISEAFAKMRLASWVTENDVNEAYDLVRSALRKAATDPQTGLLNIDSIYTGQNTYTRQRVQKLVELIKNIIKANTRLFRKTATLDTLRPDVLKKWAESDPVEDRELVEALKYLETEGWIAIYGSKPSKPEFKLAKDILPSK